MRGTNPSGPRSLSKRIRDIADAAAAFLIDARAAAYFLERALGDHPAPRFAIRLWNGRELAWGKPACTVTFRSARAFRACVASRDPTPLAEAYIAGDVSIRGDVGAAVELGFYLADRAASTPVARRSAGVSTVRKMRSPGAEARDVRTHYDHPEELFRSFLDERMVYSCAYFAHPDQSLEEAQARKLDLVCRKLQLRPGERLLDVGCGWGALVVWAAERYGVSALGITLSEPQAAEARRRVAHAGLTDRVTIAVRHYRDLGAEAFDKVGSVGMYEHVGGANLDEYVETIERVLRPGGLFLNHGITLPSAARRTGGDFIFRHVFPGAALQPLSVICAAMERAGLELLDVQSLRPPLHAHPARVGPPLSRRARPGFQRVRARATHMGSVPRRLRVRVRPGARQRAPGARGQA